MPHDYYSQWTGPVSVDNCAREPIHVPGAIQGYGRLLVFDDDARLVRHSDNVDVELGATCAHILGVALDVLISNPTAYPLTAFGTTWSVSTHRSVDELHLVELEPTTGSTPDPDLFRSAVQSLRRTSDSGAMCQRMAEEIQRLTGYDRVMVYRFDVDDHGEVIAEHTGRDLPDRYLGRHFPEGDIPAQARELYRRQVCRLLVDVDYVPSPIVPLAVPSERLDLSLAALRSVSPIHCDYLRNMGVRATLTLSILIEGRLWGLIACHHYDEPRFIARATRELAGLLTEAFTWCLHSSLTVERHLAHARAREQIQPLLQVFDCVDEFDEQLARQLPEIQDLLRADGAASLCDGRVETTGSVPDIDTMRRMVRALRARGDGLFVTDRLAETLSGLSDHDGPGCGLLAMAMDDRQQHHILVFRDERLQQVASGPSHGEVVVTEGVARLRPMASFVVHDRLVRQRSEAWTTAERETASLLYAGLSDVKMRTHRRLASRNRELREASDAKDAFLAVLSHELRNPLNSMVGWASLLCQGKVPEDKLERAYEAMRQNALAQQRLIDDLLDVSSIANGKIELRSDMLSPEELLHTATDIMRSRFDDKGIRLRVECLTHNPIRGDRERIVQILWNLLSNAAKYTRAGGKVRASVYSVDSHVVFEVEDNGIGLAPDSIPFLFERFRQVRQKGGMQGLGLGLSIVKGLADLHGAVVQVESPGLDRGCCFRVRFPAPVVKTTEVNHEIDPSDVDLRGTSVVIVDDQADAILLLEMLLQDAGCEVFAFQDPEDALDFMASYQGGLDLLVSDINMVPFDGFELAKRVHAIERWAALPMLAVTAYARGADRVKAYRAGFTAHIAKPIDTDELLAMVATMGRRHGPASAD